MANIPVPFPTVFGENTNVVDMGLDMDVRGAISKLFLEVAERELIDEPPMPREEFIASFPGWSPQEVDQHCHALFKNYEAAALGKCAQEVGEYYSHASFKNYGAAALGLFPSFAYVNHGILPFDSFGGQEPPPIIATEPSRRERIAALREGLPDRSSTNGLTWSKEEHELFLMGMECFGKGDWKNIAKYFVLSRTSTQIASHAQKFFTRRNKNNAGSRPSIHDIDVISTDQTHQYLPFYAQNVFCGGSMDFFNYRQFMMPATAANMYQAFAVQPAQQFMGYYPGTVLDLIMGPNGDDEFDELDDIMQDMDF